MDPSWPSFGAGCSWGDSPLLQRGETGEPAKGGDRNGDVAANGQSSSREAFLGKLQRVPRNRIAFRLEQTVGSSFYMNEKAKLEQPRVRYQLEISFGMSLLIWRRLGSLQTGSPVGQFRIGVH